MAKDYTEKLKAKKEYLTEWQRRYKKSQDTVPFVQRILEVTEWEIEALDNLPDEADKMPTFGLTDKFKSEYNFLKSALPLMPDYNPNISLSSTAVTTSGSVSVYEYVTRVADLGTPQALTYSLKYSGRYRELQVSQERPQMVRELLAKLNNPPTLERFDRALKACMAAKSKVGERDSAANGMRNLLHGVKGDLFSLARKFQNENMTWSKMAERLSKGIIGNPEYQELINQESEHSHLLDKLSIVSKDREGDSATHLDNLWTKLLDHIYIVLGLINFNDSLL